jgi:hypothetical protein
MAALRPTPSFFKRRPRLPLVLEWKKVAGLRAVVEACRDPVVKVPISFLAPYKILA